MEPVGSHYAIILHDPVLRRASMRQPEQPRSGQTRRAVIYLRFRLAQALRGLASHVERRGLALDLAGPHHRAAAE
jgi:hypothetical protein